MRTSIVAFALLALLAPVAPSAAVAQEESGHVGLVIGVADWDLSGTGNSTVYGLRVGAPINQNVGWELNVSYLNPEQDIGDTHFFIPELQFQLRHTWGPFTPYLGIGAGASIDKLEDDDDLLPGLEDTDANIEFASSASLGARIGIVPGFALQAEGRYHGIEPDFTGSVLEFTGGVVVSW